MIIVPEEGVGGGRLRMVTQADHAWLAGEILSLWRSDDLPENPRRREIVFAAREHDNGWRETDSAPLVSPDTGRPYHFTDLPDGPRIELWRRGTERHAQSHPYAALLICHHALALHAERRGEAPWDEELFAPLDELTETLAGEAEEAGIDPETIASDYRLLALADLVSLAVCSGATEPFRTRGYRGRVVDTTVHLAPFPLAGATSFDLRCRTITDRGYADSIDLIGELASARWTPVRVRLSPETGPSVPA